MVLKIQYHTLFWSWYLNFDTILIYTMVIEFQYHTPLDNDT